MSLHKPFHTVLLSLGLLTAGSAQGILPDAESPPVAPFSLEEVTRRPLPSSMAKARSLTFDALSQDLALAGTPDLKLEFQDDGSFAFLRNANVGEPLLPAFARPTSSDVEAAAREFLTQYAGLFGLSSSELATLVVDRNRIIGQTAYAKGIHALSLIQKVDGVLVRNARVSFFLHVDSGDLYAVTSSVFGAPKAGTGGWSNVSKGVTAALRVAGVAGRMGAIKNLGDRLEIAVQSPDLRGPVILEKTWVRTGAHGFVPGFVAWVHTFERGLLEIGVGSLDGQHLLTTPRTNHYHSYQYSGWEDYPMSEEGDLLAPLMVQATPDPVASPNGYATLGSDGRYRTIGPNAVSYYDWEDDISSYDFLDSMIPLSAPATNVVATGEQETIVYDYREQYGAAGVKDRALLSTVQNFFGLNWLHDHYYQLGFTPSEGNFQDDDPVLANVQNGYDLGSRNNANFSTPDDGMSGVMNMYVFNDEAGEERDGAIDDHIFTHELGHGLSWRLVNFGDGSLGGIQSGAFGEGNADVFAFMHEPLHQVDSDFFALAPYVGWQYFLYVMRNNVTLMATGKFANDINTPMGRFTAYTEDQGDAFLIQDPHAQRNYDFYGALPVAVIGQGARGTVRTGFYGNFTYYLAPETHSDGEIWAATLWRIRLRVEGQDWSIPTADRVAALEQTYLMGMQLMPSNPNFVQARDALLIYEEMTQDESAVCLMKSVFAQNGLGKSATGGPNGSYGTEDDWDSSTSSFPLMQSDFTPWGCPVGTYEQDSGEVTMTFGAEVPEVEVGREALLEVRAITPGHDTQVRIEGPFLGTVNLRSETDFYEGVLTFVPTSVQDGSYVCQVSSDAGLSESKTVEVRSKVATVLDAGGADITGAVALGENQHYKVFIDSSEYALGDQLIAALKSTQSVDIDFYFNVDSLAMPEDTMGYDADADGNETLKLQRTQEGWQVVNGAGNRYGVYSAGEDFWYYLDVAGFTESDFTLTLTRGQVISSRQSNGRR